MNELRQFRVYKHKFSTPLVTSYGKWEAKESIVLRRKDNNGNVYMPQFNFNGIGSLSPGYGYQIKLSESIEQFKVCDWYFNEFIGK